MATSKFLIIGGGMVAGYAAKELLSRGLKPGELTILSSDSAVPYERPPLSKGFLAGKETESGILINPAEWSQQNGIDLRLRTVVAKIDLTAKSVSTADGAGFAFENLLLATGARPRNINVPGANLDGVVYLR